MTLVNKDLERLIKDNHIIFNQFFNNHDKLVGLPSPSYILRARDVLPQNGIHSYFLEINKMVQSTFQSIISQEDLVSTIGNASSSVLGFLLAVGCLKAALKANEFLLHSIFDFVAINLAKYLIEHESDLLLFLDKYQDKILKHFLDNFPKKVAGQVLFKIGTELYKILADAALHGSQTGLSSLPFDSFPF